MKVYPMVRGTCRICGLDVDLVSGKCSRVTLHEKFRLAYIAILQAQRERKAAEIADLDREIASAVAEEAESESTAERPPNSRLEGREQAAPSGHGCLPGSEGLKQAGAASPKFPYDGRGHLIIGAKREVEDG